MRAHTTALFCALGFGLALSAGAEAAGYSTCRYPAGDVQISCGRGCPRGTTFISFNPGSHERCDKNKTSSGDGMVNANIRLKPGCKDVQNLKDDLGWRGGDKTKFCQNKGFSGVTNHPGQKRYNAYGGGYCYKGDEQACVKSLPGE